MPLGTWLPDCVLRVMVPLFAGAAAVALTVMLL